MSLFSQTKTAGTVVGLNDLSQPWTATGTLKTDVETDDTAYCFQGVAAGESSDTLRLTNFGFTIPTNAKIVGYEMSIKGKRTNVTMSMTCDVWDGSTAYDITTDPTASLGASVDATVVQGSNSTLGGSSIPIATINGSGFGCQIQTTQETNPGIHSLNYITLTVYYTVANSFLVMFE